MKKLKLGFTDTHDHLARFFHTLLANRYDVEIDNKNPDYLIFGDRNFGENNKNYDNKDIVKIFYTGENQRPDDYDCHYAISFDHNFNTWHYRLPLFIIYMWSLDQIHQTGYNYYYLLGDREIKEKTDFCHVTIDIDVTKDQLFDDWNLNLNKFGVVKTVESVVTKKLKNKKNKQI